MPVCVGRTLALTSTARVERSGRLKVAAVGVQRIVDRDGWTGWTRIGHCPLRRILNCPIYGVSFKAASEP